MFLENKIHSNQTVCADHAELLNWLTLIPRSNKIGKVCQTDDDKRFSLNDW